MGNALTAKNLIEDLAAGYEVAKDFDYYNTKLASRLICPYCIGKKVLEIGSATGEMTEDLLSVAQSITVIEPSKVYCSLLEKKFGERLTIVNEFIEDTSGVFDTDIIVIASLLHHMDDPLSLLCSLRKRMQDHALILATVPNMTSLHRRIGVKSRLLRDVYDTSERNARFAQPGRFDKDSFSEIFVEAGFELIESFGYMLKPFSNEQMMSLKLEWDVINALFELGKEFGELASQLFVCAKPGKAA